jgi:WD40 repeat protein
VYLAQNLMRQEKYAEAESAITKAGDDLKKSETALESAKKAASASEKPILALAFSSDNLTLATAGDDEKVHTWSAESGAAFETLKGHKGPVTSLAFTRDGTLVSLQYDASPEEVATLKKLSGREILLPPFLDQRNEIDRTAAVIASLDAVVSAPTSVSWIAAGLGIPTFKLLYNNSWTSFGADHEPFAPQCRLIAPAICGDWSDTFAKASAALSEQGGLVRSA